MKLQRMWADFGGMVNGDVVLSIPSDSGLYAITEFDRVVLTQSEQPFDHTYVHDGSDVVDFPVTSIKSVRWIDPTSNTLVTGSLPSVSASGVLTWVTGAPPAGASYTLVGHRNPEYFCYGDFPRDRHHQHGLALPRLVVLREFDLFSRESNP